MLPIALSGACWCWWAWPDPVSWVPPPSLVWRWRTVRSLVKLLVAHLWLLQPVHLSSLCQYHQPFRDHPDKFLQASSCSNIELIDRSGWSGGLNGSQILQLVQNAAANVLAGVTRGHMTLRCSLLLILTHRHPIRFNWNSSNSEWRQKGQQRLCR